MSGKERGENSRKEKAFLEEKG